MSSEEAANGKKSHWAELEISGKELRHGPEIRTRCRSCGLGQVWGGVTHLEMGQQSTGIAGAEGGRAWAGITQGAVGEVRWGKWETPMDRESFQGEDMDVDSLEVSESMN